MTELKRIDPITLAPAQKPEDHPIPPRDLLRLSTWGTETFLKRHQTLALLFVAAPVVWPTLSKMNASFSDPGSNMYEALMHAGARFAETAPDASVISIREQIDLLAKTLSSPLTLDHREGPTPIIGAEIIHAITSMALLGGGAASAVYRFFRSYDDGLEDGSIPVSRVFPLRQVIFGDPQVAEDFMRTQHKDGHPRYGSVFVNPKPPEDHKGRKIHGHTLPSYEFGYAVEANELLTKAPGFSKKPWAQHVGLTRPDASVVFLSQTPGHELFGSARGRIMSPSDMNLVISMLADSHPGIWQNRFVEAVCPPNDFIAGHGLTRETFALSAGKVGADVDTWSPEEFMTARMINLALHRSLKEGSGEDEAWIGVYPANDDVPETELRRMCGALKRVPIASGLPSINAEIVAPDKEHPTLGYEVLMVCGQRDSDVLATTSYLQAIHTSAREIVVGLVRRPETAEQMGSLCGTPAHTIYSQR